MTELSADNKIINGLWISPDGKPLSNLERLCIYSFCANRHDFRLWTYGDLPNIPKDTAPGKVEVRNGEEILPKSKIFFNHGSLAAFSDWFRWELMRKIGGWYVDMDVICLNPFAIPDHSVFGKDLPHLYNSAILKLEKGDDLALAMATACAHPDKIMPWDKGRRRRRKIGRRLRFWQNSFEHLKWGELGGPAGLTKAMEYRGEEYSHQPSWWFEPVVPGFESDLVDDSLHRREMLAPMLKYSFAIHFFHSVWEKYGYDKNSDFHPNSPYEVLKRRYLPELQTGGE